MFCVAADISGELVMLIAGPWHSKARLIGGVHRMQSQQQKTFYALQELKGKW